MPNGRPHLDGHLSVGATEPEAGHRRHRAMSADTIQLVSARDDGPDVRSGQVRFITRPKSRTMRAKRNKRSRANRTNVPK
jgi:hypothetical protein